MLRRSSTSASDERRLGLQREFLAAALDALSDQVVVLDGEGDIVYVNQAWADFGEENGLSSADACLGMNYLAACDVQNGDGEFALAAIRGIRALLAGKEEHFRMEYPCHSPDMKRWFSMRATPFEHGGRPYVIIAHENVTKRHLAEAALREHEVELEAFNASVSHDLRGPLRRIEFLLADLLPELAQSEETQQAVNLIQAEARRAREFVAAMLEIARVSSVAIKRHDVDLTALVERVIDEIQREDPGRRVRWKVEEGMHAFADPTLLHSVLTNLLHNAWKFTRTVEDPVIEIGKEADDGGEGFFVRDNGVGFEPRDIGRLFHAFERLPSGAPFEGTGVGLATAARIIERHGGRIRAKGAPGKGATIHFTLPRDPTAGPD